MHKEWSQSEVINQYIKSGKIMYQATLKGDYKTNNREGKIITKIFKYLESNLEFAKNTLPLLFNSENVFIRTEAAAHCLALKICINEAEKILKEASQDEDNGIFGFNAEMTMKVWCEQGYLKIYPDQKI
jgi:hypothetical protein